MVNTLRMGLPILSLLLPIAGVAFVLAILLYRLRFHSISAFPGPKIAAITGLYEIYFDIFKAPGGQYIYEIDRMHREYGPVIRVNPHELHVKDSTWVRTLYVGASEGQRNKYPRAAIMLGTPQGSFGTILHDEHVRRRKAVSSLFSKKSTQASESMMNAMAEKLVRCMDKQISENGHVDLRICYLGFSTDTLFAHCFQESLKSWDLLANYNQAKAWHTTLRTIARYTTFIKRFPISITIALNAPIWFVERFMPNFAMIVKLHREMNKEAVEARDRYSHEDLPAVVTSNVFLNIMSHKALHPSDKDPARMSQEGFELISAGTESVSRFLTEATYYILVHRDNILPRLLQELLEVMPTTSDRASLRDLEKLPWLTAIIKETLRITALITSRLPVVSPRDSLRYKEWDIPAGVPVGMTLRDILMDPQIFDQPTEFRPERWLVSNPDLEQISLYWIPFSLGSRMCTGPPFGMAELYIGLARVFRHLDLDLFDVVKSRDIDTVRDCFVGDVSSDSRGVKVRYREEA